MQSERHYTPLGKKREHFVAVITVITEAFSTRPPVLMQKPFKTAPKF